MTAIDDLRGRLAASIRLQLSHAGIAVDASKASSMAGRALQDARVEDLLTFIVAADGAASGFETVADGGTPPGDLEDRRTTWGEARDNLLTDPIYATVLP